MTVICWLRCRHASQASKLGLGCQRGTPWAAPRVLSPRCPCGSAPSCGAPTHGRCQAPWGSDSSWQLKNVGGVLCGRWWRAGWLLLLREEASDGSRAQSSLHTTKARTTSCTSRKVTECCPAWMGCSSSTCTSQPQQKWNIFRSCVCPEAGEHLVARNEEGLTLLAAFFLPTWLFLSALSL